MPCGWRSYYEAVKTCENVVPAVRRTYGIAKYSWEYETHERKNDIIYDPAASSTLCHQFRNPLLPVNMVFNLVPAVLGSPTMD